MKEKSLERKEAILQAATDLFYQTGYRNTDVQQIADRISVGKGTIYRYFVSKEDLFFAAVDRAMQKLEEYVRGKIKDEKDDIARIKLAIKSYIAFFRNHPEFTELFVQERAEFRLRDVSSYLAHRAKRDAEWVSMFQRLYAQGKVRCKNFDWIVDFITNLLYGIVFTKVFQLEQKALLDRSPECLDMLLYGILMPPSNNTTNTTS
jgi:AcrR family transcriptional regulator